MASSKLIIILVSLVTLTSCEPQIDLPKNLDEAVLYFQQQWTQSELNNFRNKSEEEAITELHFETGRWIRNNWIHGDRDTLLRNYFYSLGIFAPDDISSIILTSLHRTLNKKDVQLDKQVLDSKAYWKPIIDCNEMQKKQAVSIYNKFKKGDSMTIYMPVDTSYGSRNAVIHSCPTIEWTFDTAKDLIIKGTIANKYFRNDTSNVFFSIYITYMNRNDIPILTQQVKEGDTKDFPLIGLTLK